MDDDPGRDSQNTFAEVLSKIEEYESGGAAIPSAEFFDLIAAHREGGNVAPTEFWTVIQFASDQAARWHARWQFSPALSPDREAEYEATEWQDICEKWMEMLSQKVPTAHDSMTETHRLAFVHRTLELRVKMFDGHRVEGFFVALASQVAILLSRVNLGFVAVPLNRWALYPAGSVGRIGAQAPRDEAADVKGLNDLLIKASTVGHLESVQRLLAAGADVNTMGETGATPVMAAATNSHDSVVEYLVAHGADLSCRDEAGSTALHFACMNGAPSTVALLVEAGANLEARDKAGSSCIFDAVYLENAPVLEWLLAHGVSLDTRNDSGYTPLRFAASIGKVKVMEVLLNTGAKLDPRDESGETPLLSSLSHAQAEAAMLLLDRGADVHALDAKGATALHHAAFGGLVRLTERLLQAGLDPNACDGSGDTPMHIAASRGFPTIQRLLVEAGGNGALKNRDGKSAYDLEQEAVEPRRTTEKLRLLRALPAEISVEDGQRLVAFFDKAAAAQESDAEQVWHETRFFLEDLVHAYRVNPGRAGENRIPTDSALEAGRRVHPGET